MNEQELEKKLSQYKNIKPSPQLIHKIMADFENANKGRLSFKQLIFNQIHNLMNWKIFVPVAIAILVVAVWGVVKIGPKEIITGLKEEFNDEGYVETEYVKTPEEVSVPRATGDIDDAVGALITLSENELLITTEEGNDASLINFDSQAISDFGQSYNENEL